ncbi:YheU family protein [Legionella feeleii]|uniref:YheU family protein n=1 Tax=Legionella feeleii TaxID=453 RepID=UPI0010410D6A|nr:YheU family protein [Legionella feeleii]
MIEIDYHLLSELAIENLIMAILTREATDYGEEEMGFAQEKQQLLTRLELGDAVIIYSAETRLLHHCSSRREAKMALSRKSDRLSS